jgi:hypothetical protein
LEALALAALQKRAQTADVPPDAVDEALSRAEAEQKPSRS